MSSNYQFKFSPESLPKLTSRGDNYTEWRSAWTIAFQYVETWPVLSGKSRRPIIETEAYQWDLDNSKAFVMLISAVHSDHTMSVTSCATAADAWRHLAARFDRGDTRNLSIALFRNLTSLRYHDGDDLTLHLDEFHQRWTRLANRCAASKQSVAIAMRNVFNSDEVKGSFFLASLPDTMDTIIDNLSTRNINAFKDIEPKILDIADKHSLDTVDSSTAYAARQQSLRSNRASRTRTPTPTTTALECTWCRKHNLTFVGHLYTNCNELRKHKEANRKRR